jgi:hypothetical protein
MSGLHQMRSAFLSTLLLSCAAALAAGIGTVVVMSTLTRSETSWIAESMTGFAAAAVWMAVGIRTAGTHASKAAPIIFLLGAKAAWFLTRDIVHSTSPYYGLFAFAAACLGAMLAWSIGTWNRSAYPARGVAVILPLLMVVVIYSVALLRPPLSYTRRVVTLDSKTRDLPMVWTGQAEGREWYVWSPADVELVRNAGDSTDVEIDAGSGDIGRRAVVETRDPQTVRVACAAFRAQASESVRGEIRGGSVPAFMLKLPIRYPSCKQGRIWVVKA